MCASVAEWLRRQTNDPRVVGLNPLAAQLHMIVLPGGRSWHYGLCHLLHNACAFSPGGGDRYRHNKSCYNCLIFLYLHPVNFTKLIHHKSDGTIYAQE